MGVRPRLSYKEQLICKMGANQSSGSEENRNRNRKPKTETANFDFRYNYDVRRKSTYCGQQEEVTGSSNNNQQYTFWENSSSYWDRSWPSSCERTRLTTM